ncbi:hypothetical protein AAIP55_000806 [Flavobacterium psychrophilum]|nr:hypothetical protein [Flavobacterium psychrophilum]EKT4516682.1 hypothetical protein [Flavobacterium psychrophilum]
MKTLKLIAKIILLTLGSILILPTIVLIFVDDTPDKWYAIIPIIIFGFPMIYLGLKIKTEPKPIGIKIKTESKPIIIKSEQTKPNITAATININKKESGNSFKQTQEELNPMVINPKMHYGKLLQFLESTDIISNTASLDTLTGRIEFINKIYPDIINLSNKSRYMQDVQAAIDEFKTAYYDKILTDIQIGLLVKPNEMELKKYFSDCIYSCYSRYVDKQIIEIEKLVRQSAKENRKDNLIKIGYSAKYMFKTYELPDNGQLDEIEKIRQQFYYHKE